VGTCPQALNLVKPARYALLSALRCRHDDTRDRSRRIASTFSAAAPLAALNYFWAPSAKSGPSRYACEEARQMSAKG